MDKLAKIDDLTITKYKLSLIAQDAGTQIRNPKLAEDCLAEILRLEKEILTLKKPRAKSKNENKHISPRN